MNETFHIFKLNRAEIIYLIPGICLGKDLRQFIRTPKEKKIYLKNCTFLGCLTRSLILYEPRTFETFQNSKFWRSTYLQIRRCLKVLNFW